MTSINQTVIVQGYSLANELKKEESVAETFKKEAPVILGAMTISIIVIKALNALAVWRSSCPGGPATLVGNRDDFIGNLALLAVGATAVYATKHSSKLESIRVRRHDLQQQKDSLITTESNYQKALASITFQSDVDTKQQKYAAVALISATLAAYALLNLASTSGASSYEHEGLISLWPKLTLCVLPLGYWAYKKITLSKQTSQEVQTLADTALKQLNP